MDEQDRQRQLRFDRLEARLDEHARQVLALLAAERERAAEALVAELNDDDGPDEEPVRPPLPEAGIFASAEEAAAAVGPWSPEFQAWRAEHIPSSRGII